MVTPRAGGLAAPGAPWLARDLRPTAALRAVLDEDPRRHQALLLGISSVLVAFLLCSVQWSACRMYSMEEVPGYWPGSIVGTIVLSALVAFPLAWLALHASAFATWWIGKTLGGSGRIAEVRSALAWTLVPALVLAPWPLMRMRSGESSLVVGIALFALAATAAMVFLAEAHRFRMRAAIATIVLSAACLVLAERLVVGLLGKSLAWGFLLVSGSHPW